MAVPTAAPPTSRPSAFEEFVPGVAVFRTYQRGWLAKDLVAGLVLSALLVPQGMAYAELAGLPPVTGLYTSILCLLGYAVFGPSRILVLGPDSSLGPMIAATITSTRACAHDTSGGRPATEVITGWIAQPSASPTTMDAVRARAEVGRSVPRGSSGSSSGTSGPDSVTRPRG